MTDKLNFDKNFSIPKSIQKDDIVFYNALCDPFKIYGLIYPQNEKDILRRMPGEVAETVSDGVNKVHAYTTGGRLRFITDSPYIAIHAVLGSIFKIPHSAIQANAGFDMYFNKDGVEVYQGTFRPPFDIENGYESVIDCGDGEKTVTINFPIYSNVNKLEIGLKEGAILKEAPGYKYSKPVVYYGSSVTHGGCASRPGNTYEGMISRRLDCDFINLGFPGSAKGEDEIAEYISGLDMSVFVYDYDYNAPSPEHLEKTHEKMFLKIRSKNPQLPIIMITRPKSKYYFSENDKMRAEIIRKTYENAIKRGDENVYFILGRDLMTGAAEIDGTLDGIHPNDLGFAAMAEKIGNTLKDILEK